MYRKYVISKKNSEKCSMYCIRKYIIFVKVKNAKALCMFVSHKNIAPIVVFGVPKDNPEFGGVVIVEVSENSLKRFSVRHFIRIF